VTRDTKLDAERAAAPATLAERFMKREGKEREKGGKITKTYLAPVRLFRSRCQNTRRLPRSLRSFGRIGNRARFTRRLIMPVSRDGRKACVRNGRGDDVNDLSTN